MSGFSDVFYQEATARLSKSSLPKKPHHYRTMEEPSIWFDASEVLEVRGAELSISPVHQASIGHVHPDRGLGLRFPRFVHRREDKSPEEDATTANDVLTMFQSQGRKSQVAPRARQAGTGEEESGIESPPAKEHTASQEPQDEPRMSQCMTTQESQEVEYYY